MINVNDSEWDLAIELILAKAERLAKCHNASVHIVTDKPRPYAKSRPALWAYVDGLVPVGAEIIETISAPTIKIVNNLGGAVHGLR